MIAFSVFCIIKIVNGLYKTVDNVADKAKEKLEELVHKDEEKEEEKVTV